MQVGDWGRQNNEDQARVAKLMGDVAECMGPLFVISTGDNFYPSESTEGRFTKGRHVGLSVRPVRYGFADVLSPRVVGEVLLVMRVAVG